MCDMGSLFRVILPNTFSVLFFLWRCDRLQIRDDFQTVANCGYCSDRNTANKCMSKYFVCDYYDDGAGGTTNRTITKMNFVSGEIKPPARNEEKLKACYSSEAASIGL